MDFKAAIFDFDGTLVDSMKMWQNNARKWAERNRITLTKELTDSFRYSTLDQITSYLRQNYENIDVNKALRQWCFSAFIGYMTEVRPIDGAKQYLQKLDKCGIKIAVATNCPRTLCRAALFRLGMLKYINAVVSSTSIGKGKNEPDVFLKAARLLNVLAEECMVYEDSHIALEGAGKANMRFTGILSPDSAFNEKLRAESDVCITSYRELI